MPGTPLLAVPAFLATTALAAPTTWHIAALTSSATGARTVHVGLSTDPYQGGRETFALATLDTDGLHTVDLDWSTTLGTTLGGSLNLTVATSPAPAQDLEILFEDGTTLMVHLPSTEHTAHGALFFVDPDDGRAWWADQDHDGLALDDALSASAAQVYQHLAGSPDEVADPVEVAAPDDGRLATTLTAVAPGAFELGSDLLGDREGHALDGDTLLRGQQRLLQISVDGHPVHLPDYPGVSGRDGALVLRPVDLSDADWTTAEVVPGTIAVDPALGRIRFSAGNDAAGFEPLGEWTTHWGDPTSACLDGAGLGAITQRESEASVILLDLADPVRPAELGATSAGWSYGCAFHDGTLFVVSRSGVTAVDIGDPSAPVAGTATNLGVGSAYSALAVVDGVLVAQPGAVQLVTAAVDGGVTLLGGWELPPELATLTPGLLDDTRAWVLDGEDLVVLSLGEDAPTVEARVPLGLVEAGAIVYGAVVVGDHLYLAAASDGLLVVDITAGQVVQRIQEPPAGGWDHLYSVALDDDGRVWTWGDDGTLDMADPRRWMGQRVRAYDVQADGTLAEALRVEEQAPYATPWWLHPVDGDLLWALDGEYGFRAVDLSGGGLDTMGGLPSAGLTNDVAVGADGLVYTAEYLGGGLHIATLDDGGFSEVGYLHRGTSAWGIATDHAGRVYAGGRIEGVEHDNTTFNSWSGQVGVDLVQEGAWGENLGGQAMYDIADLGEGLASNLWLWWHDADGHPSLVSERIFASSYNPALVQGRYLVYGPTCTDTFASLWADGAEHDALIVLDAAIPSVPVVVWLEADEADTCHYGSIAQAGDTLLFPRGGSLDTWDFSDPRHPLRGFSLDQAILYSDVETVTARGDWLYVHGWSGDESLYDLSAGLEAPVLAAFEDTDSFGYRSRLFGERWYQTRYWGLAAWRVPRSDERPEAITLRYFARGEDPVDTGDPGDTGSAPTDDTGPTAEPEDHPPTDDCGCGGGGGAGALLGLLALVGAAVRRRSL
ncbi:MAG: RCC1 domain-containing protein [Pseudomonadota bacterium]